MVKHALLREFWGQWAKLSKYTLAGWRVGSALMSSRESPKELRCGKLVKGIKALFPRCRKNSSAGVYLLQSSIFNGKS
jgi:hypothetical protein